MDSENSLFGSVQIRRSNYKKLNSNSFIWQLGVLDSVSSAHLNVARDINSVSFINAVNELNVEYSTPYGEKFLTQRGKFEVPFRRDRYSRAVIKPIDLDLYSTYIVPYTNGLQSLVKFTEHSELDIAYRLIQAPIIQEIIPVIKDTYTRESRPTLNHGGRETLIMGNASDGQYVTYMDLDLSKIKETLIDGNMINNGIELSLTVAGGLFGKLEIYECLNVWDEYSVTWMTDLTLGNKLLEHDITSTNTLVDISDVVLSLLQQGKTRLNIAVKSNDFIFIRSKESIMPPYIRFRHSDPNWTAFGNEYEQMSKALIQLKELDNLGSIVNILEKFTINSKVIINKLKSELPSESHIQSDWSYKNLRGRAKVEKLKSDLASTILVRSTTRSNGLKSSYYQPSIPQIGTVQIKQINDMNSVVSILSDSLTKDFPSQAHLLLYYMKSIVDIFDKITLESKALITAIAGNDMHSVAEIRKIPSDILSRLIIAEGDHLDNPGRAVVIGGGLSSIYRLGLSKDMHNTAYIIGTVFQDTNSIVELRSRVYEEFYSNITIRKSLNSSLLSGVGVKHVLDLNSIVDIINYTVLNSFGTIRQFDIRELGSRVSIAGMREFRRFPALATIKRREYHHLLSKINISTTSRKWVPNPNRRLPRLWIRENFIKD